MSKSKRPKSSATKRPAGKAAPARSPASRKVASIGRTTAPTKVGKAKSKPAAKTKPAPKAKTKPAPKAKAKSTARPAGARSVLTRVVMKPIAKSAPAKSAKSAASARTSAGARAEASARITAAKGKVNAGKRAATATATAKPAARPAKTPAQAPAKAAGPWPGRFVWHDLMTTDAAASQAFYCALFGWQIQAVPMQGFTYHMILAGDGPIGGIVEEKNIPCAHWMPYLAVADVDAAAARLQQLGGSQCVPPTDIPDTGRFAVVGDPQGAYFSLYKGLPTSPGFDPDQPVVGRVCWNELLTTDPEAAQRFYTALVGWQEQPKDMGPMGVYRVQMLGTAQAGGLMRHPQPGAPSCWLAYFCTDDLAKATARSKQLGAKTMVENAPIPGVGSFSLLQDPVGATFALFMPAPGSRPC